MKFEVVIFIGVCCIMASLVDAKTSCITPQCYDCSLCEVDCNTVEKACDSDCLAEARKFLCILVNKNCKEAHGCNIPSTSIEIYPAANYDTTNAEWAPLTLEMRPNCCYNLNNPAWQPWYDNTLSGLKTQGACVMLYDGCDCTGTSLRVDSTWTEAQLKWIDDGSRTGIEFNDVTSSMRLC